MIHFGQGKFSVNGWESCSRLTLHESNIGEFDEWNAAFGYNVGCIVFIANGHFVWIHWILYTGSHLCGWQYCRTYGASANWWAKNRFIAIQERKQNINFEHFAGAALAGKYLGYQCGYSLSLLLQETSLGWWFGWSIIAPIIFILAIVVGLFPSRLLATAVRQAANTIVETAISSSQLSLARGKLLSDISFVSSIKRILRNKILLLNILAAVFIETALVNYALQEQNYLQSRFLLPADSSELLKNEWTSRTITKFLQPVMVALAILIGGLVIAKANPSSR